MKNQIFNENCLITMARMPDGIVDMTLTSPPYDDLRSYTGYSFDFEQVAHELYRVTKSGGVVVWVVGDSTRNGSESGTSFKQALFFKDVGFNLHDTMIYHKKNYVPLTHNRYEQTFEYMFVLSKGKPATFTPIRLQCKNAGKLEKYGNERRANFGATHSMRHYDDTVYIATKATKIAGNVFSYVTGAEKTGHPAAFPLALAEDQVRTWSKSGELVYDPFLGSGTTAKAALLHWRDFIGSEISQEYCCMAQNRIQPLLDDPFQ